MYLKASATKPQASSTAMLLKFNEQVIDNFLIPAFTLSKGEIVIIRLPNGPLTYALQLALVKMLTGKTANDKVKITSPLTFVEHFKESRFKSRFFPMTIGAYHRRYADQANPVYKKIFETHWITSHTKVKTLAGNLRKKLALYTTLSHTNHIIFDLAGVDPQGAQDIFGYVKTIVNNGGSAILLNYWDGFQNECTTFIKAGYLGSGEAETIPVPFEAKPQKR